MYSALGNLKLRPYTYNFKIEFKKAQKRYSLEAFWLFDLQIQKPQPGLHITRHALHSRPRLAQKFWLLIPKQQ